MQQHSKQGLCFRVTAAAMAASMIASAGQAQTSWSNTGDGAWSDPDNWDGGIPDLMSDVWIGNLLGINDDTVTLDLNAEIASLQISDGMTLDMSGGRLRVNGDTAVTGANGEGNNISRSQLRIENADNDVPTDFITQNLSISNGGLLNVRLGALAVITGQLRTFAWENRISVNNFGTLRFTDSGTTIVNDGVIGAWSPDARIESLAGFLDLDGFQENGRLTASITDASDESWGHTIVARGLTDAFDGRMSIGSDNFIDMQLDETWELGVDGELRFSQGSSNELATPTLRGSDVHIEGFVRSNADFARIESDVSIGDEALFWVLDDTFLRMEGDANIMGGFFGAFGGRLVFSGPNTTLQAGSFLANDGGYVQFDRPTIAGNADFQGETRMFSGASVTLDSVLDVEQLNTGFSAFESDVWDLSADLTINADAIGNAQGQIVDPIRIGRNGLNPATWTVNLSGDQSYRLSGDIEIDHFTFGGGTTSIAGSDVLIDGDIDINGFTRFNARVDLDRNRTDISNGALEFAGGSIDNPNTWDNVFISSLDSELRAAEGVGIEGTGVVTGSLNFAPGSSLIATPVGLFRQLILSSDFLSMGTLGTRGEDAILTLGSTYDTSVGEFFIMEGGQVSGGGIENTNATGIRGFGDLIAGTTNETVIAADGGRLVIDKSLDDGFFFFDTNDLDGTGNEGELHAVLGSMTIVDESSDFGGTLRVAGSNDVTLQDTAFVFTEGSLVEMQGGVMISNELQTFAGELRTSDAAARLDTDAVFTSSSSNKLVTNLVLTGETDVHAGAEFGSSGRLVNSPTGELTLFDGAAIGVDVTADGSVYLGDMVIDSGIGDASISDDLFLSGQLIVDLAGNAAPLYDQLAIADTITVRDAVFDVGYLAGFQAGAGDEFDILDFAIFEDFGYTLLLPELAQGLVWDSSDFETFGIIRVDFIPTPGSLTALLIAGAVTTRRRRA